MRVAAPSAVAASAGYDRPGPSAVLRLSGALGASTAVLAGNAAYVALSFGTNVLLARALAPQELGVIAVATGVLVVLQEVCGGGLDVAVTRAAAAAPSRAVHVFAAGLFLKLVTNGLLAIALSAAAGPVAALLGIGSSAGLVRIAALGLFASSLYAVTLTRLQSRQRFADYAWLRAAVGTVKLGMLLALWMLASLPPPSVLWASVAAFGAATVVGLWLDGEPLPWAVPSWPVVRQLARFGSAVVTSRLLFALYGRLDLFFISATRTLDEVAVYAVATNLTYAIDLAAYSLVVARLPEAASLTGRDALRRHAHTTLLVAGFAVLTLLPVFAMAGWIVQALFSARYLESVAIFRILFVGSCLTVLIHPLYVVLYARERAASLVLADASLVIVTLAAAPLVVPMWGAVGAAVVSVVARAVGCTVILGLVMRELTRPDESSKMVC